MSCFALPPRFPRAWLPAKPCHAQLLQMSTAPPCWSSEAQSRGCAVRARAQVLLLQSDSQPCDSELVCRHVQHRVDHHHLLVAWHILEFLALKHLLEQMEMMAVRWLRCLDLHVSMMQVRLLLNWTSGWAS